MNHNLFGLALAATSSLAFAHGEPHGAGQPGEPTTLQGTGNVTFQAGKGITFDGGDAFMLNLSHRLQIKGRYVNNDVGGPDTTGFRVRRARQKVKGHVFRPEVTFMLNVDHAETVSSKDVWLKWDIVQGETPVSIRLGQQKTRGGLQSDGTSGGLEFVERSLATRTFADARSQGVLVEGSALEDHMLHWHAGAFNSDPAAMSFAASENSTNTFQNELNFTFGVRFDPHGDAGRAEAWTEGDLMHSGEMKSTVGATLEILNEGGPGADVETTVINIFGALQAGNGMAGQGEVWIRSEDVTGGADSDSMGWYVQGSITTDPAEGETQWGGAVRISMVDFDDVPGIGLAGAAPLDGGIALTGFAGDVFEINGALNVYYNDHKFKTQIGYTYQAASPDGGTDADNHAVEVMTTLVF